MFRVKSSNSTLKIFIFIHVDHVCRHSKHLLYKRIPRYTLGSSVINSSKRIRYIILVQFNFVFQWDDSIYRNIKGLIYSRDIAISFFVLKGCLETEMSRN